MAYVYEHWRPDLNQPFWVGKGSGLRSHLIARRNKHHTGIVKKLREAGLSVEVKIIADGLSDEEAFTLEKERIELWKSGDVRLANQSVGGRGGMSGCQRSAESRAKQSATNTGRKLSESHRERIVARLTSPEYRAAVSAFHTGRKRPKETGERIRAAHLASGHKPPGTKGKKTSEETKNKQRAAKTPEIRARLSLAAKRQWKNPVFRALVSETMKRTNAMRRNAAHA